jgi:dipeptidase D
MLEGLKPEKVFHYFEEISRIPRGSYNEGQISAYCEEFARDRGLECIRDVHNNVIIIKGATDGYENAPAVIIQGHLDMVCEKEATSEHDFKTQPLELVVEDGFVSARGTTLGGDDGIAIAYALALLDSDDISHPRLEAVFTVSEETGMEGASAIDLSMLEGRYLLNLDSEEEGTLLTSCAGGSHVECTRKVAYGKVVDVFDNPCFVSITVSGLTGGHSGTEIDKGRANANVLLGRVLAGIRDSGIAFSICGIDGGSKDNAIPVNACARLVLEDNGSPVNDVIERVAALEGVIGAEYAATDKGISIGANECDACEAVMDAASTDAVIALLNVMPDGVVRQSFDIPGMVETSLNLGIVGCDEDRFHMDYLLRSSRESALDYLESRLSMIAGGYGAAVNVSSRYPAWEYIPDSALRTLMIDTYRDMYGSEPSVESIHAGVECGIMAGKLEGLDCVSFGPNLYDIHTPRERMDIASVGRTWEYIKEILARLKGL